MKEQFDNNFEDLGWQQMSALLDREMPVEKRRRRFAFWWILAGAAVVVVGIFYYIQTTKTAVETTVSKPIATVEQTVTATDLDRIKPSETIDNQLVANKNDVQNTTTRPSKLSRPMLSKTQFYSSISQKQTPQYLDNFIEKKPSATLTKAEIDQNQTPQYSTDFNEKKPSAILTKAEIDQNTPPQYKADFGEKRTVLTTEKLPLLDLELVFNPALPTLSLPKETSKKWIQPSIFKTNWHFGIAIGGHTEGVKKGNNNLLFANQTTANDPKFNASEKGLAGGFMAGLVAKKVVSKKWDLNLGLTYRLADLSVRPFTYGQISSADIGSFSVGTASSALVQGNSWQLKRLHYVELPVSAEYQFAKKWSYQLGVKTSYLVRRESVQYGNSTFYRVDTSNRDLVNNKSGFSLDASYVSIGSIQTQKWDVAVMGSIDFLPNRHWDLGLRYDFGLLNILKKQNNAAFNRYLGLNGTYFF